MKKLIFSLCLVSLFEYALPQKQIDLLFWNLENLFDPSKDSISNDDEFTPTGSRYWSYFKYRKKINMIWKTIYLSASARPPEIVTVCEIENAKVLKDIFKYSPLNKYNYCIEHKDSPDFRGIDVALIVDMDLFDSVHTVFIQPEIPEMKSRKTRDILHSCLYKNGEELHVFVNHWPSKYGGTGLTDILRIGCAKLLLSEIIKIQRENKKACILCCGDFNDTRNSRCIDTLTMERNSKQLLFAIDYYQSAVSGTLKYHGRWETIDQFFATEALIKGRQKFCLLKEKTKILAPEYLLEEDDKYGGIKVFRTFVGFSYHGGFSDHLPVKTSIIFK